MKTPQTNSIDGLLNSVRECLRGTTSSEALRECGVTVDEVLGKETEELDNLREERRAKLLALVVHRLSGGPGRHAPEPLRTPARSCLFGRARAPSGAPVDRIIRCS